VLAIPPKRSERNVVTYLTDPEVDALLHACDQTRWTGRRDHAMFALTVQTGLRISELAGLSCQDVTLGAGANVHTVGKGRKERHTPLVPSTRAVLKAWLGERGGDTTDPLFPTITGGQLSRDAIERRLTLHLAVAADRCPSLRTKHVTAHTLRHTAAMRLLLAGNDITVIALWLGHYVGDLVKCFSGGASCTGPVHVPGTYAQGPCTEALWRHPLSVDLKGAA
jgi:integrase/recombinase XerD